MPNFNKLLELATSQQIKLLGGEPVVFENNTSSITCTVVIDRNVNVMQENGSLLTNATVISFQKREVGDVKPGDSIVAGLQRFSVKDVLSDDGVVIEAYVR